MIIRRKAMKKIRVLASVMIAAALIAGVLPLNAVAASTVITGAEMIDYSAFAVGMTAGEAITATVPDGAHYHIVDTYWYCDTDDEMMGGSDVFEYAKLYSFCMMLKADDGYAFSYDTKATVNGGTSYLDGDYSCYDESENVFYIYTLPGYPLYDGDVSVIETVNVVITEIPADGMKVWETGEPDVDGIGFEIRDWYWFNDDENESMDDDDVFTAGLEFSLFVDLAPTEGYVFGDTTRFYINGYEDLIDMDNTSTAGEYSVRLWSVPGTVEMSNEVDFVEIKGSDKPVTGKKAGDMPEAFVMPDAPYSLIEYGWYKAADQTAMKPDDTFEADVEYYFAALVRLNEGSEFSIPISVILSSFELDYDRCVVNENDLYVCSTPVTPFAELIYEITITGFTEPENGQTPADLPPLSVPEGVNYRINEARWFCDTTNDDMYDDDEFETGYYYSLNIIVAPSDGCAFSNAAVITINGESVMIDPEYSSLTETGSFNIWTLPKNYSGVDNEIIREVGLDGIRPPVAGETAGVSLAGISLPDGAPYTISNAIWFDAASGDISMEPEDVFASGGTYYIFFELNPAPGYRFDSDELPDVFFNASSEYVDGDYTRVSKAGSLYCYTFDFEAEESAAVVFGDINGDGTANNKDVVTLFKYLSGGDVKVNEDALDCNGDGQINNKDIVSLFKYVSSNA